MFIIKYAILDLVSVFETAITQRQKIELDETKVKQDLLRTFLEKLEKKNNTVIFRRDISEMKSV